MSPRLWSEEWPRSTEFEVPPEPCLLQAQVRRGKREALGVAVVVLPGLEGEIEVALPAME